MGDSRLSLYGMRCGKIPGRNALPDSTSTTNFVLGASRAALLLLFTALGASRVAIYSTWRLEGGTFAAIHSTWRGPVRPCEVIIVLVVTVHPALVEDNCYYLQHIRPWLRTYLQHIWPWCNNSKSFCPRAPSIVTPYVPNKRESPI
jgi:hypothetical protein